MKNAISFYYNFILDDIHQKDGVYYFDYADAHYVLVIYDGDPAVLNDIYNLHVAILKNGLYVHQIVLNKENQIVTLINGNPYILLKTIYYKDKITYNMVIDFLSVVTYKYRGISFLYNNLNDVNKGMSNSLLERLNWGDLWSEKNDYMEYQISKVGQKYLDLRDSFSYYIGLGETAISLIGSLSIMDTIEVVSHRRINMDFTVFDLYNPLNFIIDSRVRDVAEYFKASFFSGNSITYELDYFLKYSNLKQTEYLLFLARMLYPTYYFDLFEDIISGKRDKNEMKKITSLANDYENVLRKIYVFCRSRFNLQPIEWLDTRY